MMFSTILTFFVVPAAYIALEKARVRLQRRQASSVAEPLPATPDVH
jgi:hypothetical protein